MRIAIDADPAGFELKVALVKHLEEKGIDIVDFAPDSDKIRDIDEFVPDMMPLIQKGEFDFGIVICGTGMGVSQIANSYKGIRAALCESVFTAKLSRAINNSNVLCMGGFIVAPWMANAMVDVFLSTNITEDESLESVKDFLLDLDCRVKELEEEIYKNQ